MYASLITAGASALYDLYKSATSKTGSTDTAAQSTASDQTAAASTGVGTVASVTPASTSGSKFSDALNKLFTDLQSSATSSTDQTGTVANDLQSLSKGLNAAGGHGHHHGPKPASGSQSASTDDGSSNPFGGLASSLVAYAKTQSLGASSSTSLTA